MSQFISWGGQSIGASASESGRVFSREHSGHSRHLLPTAKEIIIHMDITRWSSSKSDWLFSLQLKMETLYTVSKNKTCCWLWLRSWSPYCQNQTGIEERRENLWAIQVWPKSNPWWLYSGGDRFQGLGLIDRVPKELWTEVHNIVQEAVAKTIPRKKKCKKARWLTKEVLQITEKRREAKGKRERQRYI